MRVLILLLMICPALVWAQSSEVKPDELGIEVLVGERETPPYVGEMLMITIRGMYHRHVTRETLVQPDLEGFNWTQLGPDIWGEERIRGQKVKILERRMALYPVRAGTLTIGSFAHRLTLTDEQDDWFDHEILTAPVTIRVLPIPAEAKDDWWFPASRLRISDQWSNAPDQLQPGEGVLRILHLEAVGATPEMIPPMPELTSPSAMIFPHPEKRLVELSPDGPVTHAFWRWTIRPTNGTSAIVEPLTVRYFDTVGRVLREASISAQRVSYGEVTPAQQSNAAPPDAFRLPGFASLILGVAVFGGGIFAILHGHRFAGGLGLRRFRILDPDYRALFRAARHGDRSALRKAAIALLRDDAKREGRAAMLKDFDTKIFGKDASEPDLQAFARAFARGTRVKTYG